MRLRCAIPTRMVQIVAILYPPEVDYLLSQNTLFPPFYYATFDKVTFCHWFVYIYKVPLSYVSCPGIPGVVIVGVNADAGVDQTDGRILFMLSIPPEDKNCPLVPAFPLSSTTLPILTVSNVAPPVFKIDQSVVLCIEIPIQLAVGALVCVQLSP